MLSQYHFKNKLPEPSCSYDFPADLKIIKFHSYYVQLYIDINTQPINQYSSNSERKHKITTYNVNLVRLLYNPNNQTKT